MQIARELVALGYTVVATRGTAAAITAAGIACAPVNKVTEGRPHIVDRMKNGEISAVINTVEQRRNAIADSRVIRTTALAARVPVITTIAGAEAVVRSLRNLPHTTVRPLQEWHGLAGMRTMDSPPPPRNHATTRQLDSAWQQGITHEHD